MPMPKPTVNETEQEFMKRFMSDPMMVQEYDDESQRYAIAKQQWKINMKEWDRKFINDLPDSAFAIILPGGEKDEEGKTVPRILRKLPYKNNNGKIDLPHLRNALARLPQSELTPDQRDKANSILQRAAKKENVGEATEMKNDLIEMKDFEILYPGTFISCSTGKTKVTDKDIDDIITNFKNGIFIPKLNLDHNDEATEKIKQAIGQDLGIVSELRKVGNKLIANFKNVPRVIAELINSNIIKKRSVEFLQDLKDSNGKMIGSLLKAVSFFGDGSPAVPGLSDNFKVLLKFKEGTREIDKQPIIISLDDYKENKQMENMIQVDKNEFENLVSFKNSNEFKDKEITKLKEDNKNLNSEIESLKNENTELNKFKDQTKVEKIVLLKKEATDFVNKLINEKKLMPKFKEDKIADYIVKAKDETKLALFKEDLETRNDVAELNDIELNNKSDAPKSINFKEASNDDVDKAITRKMKAENISYMEAAKKLGVIDEEEV